MMTLTIMLAVMAAVLVTALIFTFIKLTETGAKASALSTENSILTERSARCDELALAIKNAEQELVTLKTSNAALNSQLTEFSRLKSDIEKYRQDITRLSSENSSLQTSVLQQHKAMEEKMQLLEKAEIKFKDIFQSLSSEILKANSTQFLELANQNLDRYQSQAKEDLEKRHLKFDELIKPIRETLGSVDKKITEVEKERMSSFRVLDEQIKSLRASEEMLKNETANLVNALRRPTVRGRWGEMQLRKVVEMAGMVKYCDFREQVGTDSIRPDMIINLPNRRSIIVDAKTPLEAYLNSVEATDETLREHFLIEHARHVHNHIKALSAKAYWQQFDQSPEFVVMFLPGEMFFSAALEKMPQLIEKGIESKVILSTPTTLIALLQAVAYGWRQEQLAQSANMICDLGKTLYERLAVMTGHFAALGKHLDRAADSYNKTVGSFEGRVLVTARKFEELAAGTDGGLKQIDAIDTKVREINEQMPQ